MASDPPYIGYRKSIHPISYIGNKINKDYPSTWRPGPLIEVVGVIFLVVKTRARKG